MRVGFKACTQTNTRRPLQAVEMGTPSPRYEQPHNMSNHNPNGIRAHNLNRFRETDGRTLAPGWYASRNEPYTMGNPCPTPGRTLAGSGAGIFLLSRG